MRALLLLPLLLVTACFPDGPIGPILGGPLRSGEIVEDPVRDWSFARDVEEIELQLVSQSRSRTTWILVHEDRAYVPSNVGFPPGKGWFDRAREDGRAVLRIEGKRYPVMLEKVEDEALIEVLGGVDVAKYPEGPPGKTVIWYFAVVSRSP